jgi:hypothetical protein
MFVETASLLSPLFLFGDGLGVGFSIRVEELLAALGQAALISGVVMSQSGRHFRVTTRRSWRRSSTVGRPRTNSRCKSCKWRQSVAGCRPAAPWRT